MEYPKKVKIEDKKLFDYMTKKGEIIKIGIEKSNRLEEIEKEQKELDIKIQEEEKKVDISEKEKDLTTIVEDCVSKMQVIKKDIYERMKEQVDNTLIEKYESLEKERKELEEERNKIALKAQKYNDKIIPLGKKLMSEFIEDEYDDYETLKIENGEIVATIFNHLHDFKENFKKNVNK